MKLPVLFRKPPRAPAACGAALLPSPTGDLGYGLCSREVVLDSDFGSLHAIPITLNIFRQVLVLFFSKDYRNTIRADRTALPEETIGMHDKAFYGFNLLSESRVAT